MSEQTDQGEDGNHSDISDDMSEQTDQGEDREYLPCIHSNEGKDLQRKLLRYLIQTKAQSKTVFL